MVKAVYPKAKTFVIPNGIDLEEFNLFPSEKDKSFFNKYTGYDCSQKKIIVSMGRLHKIKGFDILISAFAELQKKVNTAVLLIAGEDFGEKANLENLIEQRKLKEKVFLVGKLTGNEKLEFLHNADYLHSHRITKILGWFMPRLLPRVHLLLQANIRPGKMLKNIIVGSGLKIHRRVCQSNR